MTDSLTQKTIHGLKWSYYGIIVNAILQIGFTAMMARLLDATEFGLIAMASVVLKFGSYFAQMGIGPALIQKSIVSDDDIRIAFTYSVLFGAGFAFLVAMLSPLSHLIFQNDAVIPIVRVMSISLILSGIVTTAQCLLRRDLFFKELMIADIASFAIGAGVVGLSMAFLGFGVWSLVASQLTQLIILCAITYYFRPHSIRPLFRWRTGKTLVTYGSKFSLITFIEFLSYSSDTIMIGRYLGSSAIGIYNRASLLINLPGQYISTSLAKVLFPSMSRVQNEIERLRTGFLSALLFLGILLFALATFVSFSSKEIVLFVLGNKWQESIPILRLLCIAMPFNLLLTLNTIVLDATGKLTAKLIVRIMHLSSFLILCYIFYQYGIMGFAGAFVVNEVIFYIVFGIITGKSLKSPWSELATIHLIFVSLIVLIGITTYLSGLIGSMIFSTIYGVLGIKVLFNILASGMVIIIGPPKYLRMQLQHRILPMFSTKQLPVPLARAYAYIENRYNRMSLAEALTNSEA
jgi:lipopolysaccharide exporter